MGNRRFSGLFKVEWSGDGAVLLSAKTYYCYNKTNSNLDKYSSKGVNRNIKLTRDHFLSVLKTKQSITNTNKGFMMKNNKMVTYAMNKEGLSYFYCKRKVLDDGITTTYLDV